MAGISQGSETQADTYVVKPGDTLYKIAHAHDVDVSQLEQLNGITDPTQLRIGATLRLNGSTPAPKAPVTTAPVPVPTPVEPVATATPPKASDAAVISWAWPADGKIIQSFNSNTKGLEIGSASCRERVCQYV